MCFECFCLFPFGDRQGDPRVLCLLGLLLGHPSGEINPGHVLRHYVLFILLVPPWRPATRPPFVFRLSLLLGHPSGEINPGHCSLLYFLVFLVVPSWRPANLSPLVLALVLLRGHPSGEEPILVVFFSALLLLVSPLVWWFSSLATRLEKTIMRISVRGLFACSPVANAERRPTFVFGSPLGHCLFACNPLATGKRIAVCCCCCGSSWPPVVRGSSIGRANRRWISIFSKIYFNRTYLCPRRVFVGKSYDLGNMILVHFHLRKWNSIERRNTT